MNWNGQYLPCPWQHELKWAHLPCPLTWTKWASISPDNMNWK
jgi:hypothetical protein